MEKYNTIILLYFEIKVEKLFHFSIKDVKEICLLLNILYNKQRHGFSKMQQVFFKHNNSFQNHFSSSL